MKNITIKEWFRSVHRLVTVGSRVFHDIWPQNAALILPRIFCTIATASLPFAIYWSYSHAVGALSERTSVYKALWYVCGALAISFVINIIQIYDAFRERQFWHRLQTRLNILYLECKGRLGLDRLESPEFRDTVTRAEEKPIWPAMNIAENQFMNLSNAVRLSVALFIIGAYDIKLCLLMIASLVPQFIVDIRHGTTLWMIFMGETDERRRYSELNRHLRQRSSLVELKMFQNVDYFVTRIGDILLNFQKSQEKAERRKHIYSAATIILGGSILSAVLVTIALRVIHGVTPLSIFVFLWGSTQNMHATLSGTLKSIAQQNEFALYATDMYAVMDAEPEAVSRKGTLVCADRIPEIVFEHVTFRYPYDIKKRIILKDVSFRIRPGERVALVGCNAAGKTTLVRLLCGIYEPTEGNILIDGVNLKEMDIQSLKQKLSILFQDYARYQMPVQEIIGLGNTQQQPNDELILEAATRSGLDKFVADLPEGYRTQIGKDFKGGIEPSGGQSQRIALARVAYRKGKVVILDEPTASLDVFAEAEIFEELERHARDATLVFITHRFSTIKNADHIIVFDCGKIIEEGNHPSLMQKSGLYARMFMKQAEGYMSQPIKNDD